MRANCFAGKHKVEVRDVPEPKILNARDAIVRVTSTAICGSDLHLVNGFIPTVQKGDVLGHEFMGEVMELGPAVSNLRVGDRVVVPFTISCGRCRSCQEQLYSLCENSNPNAWIPEKLYGHSPAGVFGYSHMLGGFAGGQAEFVRVPFADVGPLKVPDTLSDDQVLFLSDILPTGYMGADMCAIERHHVIAVWGAGPVGQLAIASARLLGAARIIAIDRSDFRLRMAKDKAGADDTINLTETDVYEELQALTGGRGPDACIDAVGMEAHGGSLEYAYDRTKQALMLESDRPSVIRQAIRCCKNGGTVSIIGVYGGFIDKFPIGSLMNRSLTIRSGQCHVQRYMPKLLAHIERGELDASFIITDRLPLEDAAKGYHGFDKRDEVVKVVLQAGARGLVH